MSYETFRGRNVSEAVAAVKAAFGANAVIASTRHVSNGRTGGLAQSFVEVTAAPGNNDASPSPFSRAAHGAKALPSSMTAPRSAPRLSSNQKPANDTTLEELRALRTLIEEMRANKAPASIKAPSRALAMLHHAGVEGALAAELASGAPRTRGPDEQVRAWLQKKVTSMLAVIPSPIAQPGPRLVTCVGPTGAGKTTTLAKLAWHAAENHGKSVAILTLDTFRVGAVDQMRRFAELLDVQFAVAEDAEQFERATRGIDADLLLVDTPSRMPSDRTTMNLIAECLSTVHARVIDVLLTVPASIRPRDVEALESVFQTCAPTALVVTKLDETTQAGGSLHAATRGPLPLAYLCSGPRVPEDISPASAEALASAVFETPE